MRAALSRCCAFGVVFVACAVLAVPALADPSVPTNLTAVVRSDHTVDLAWSWPSPTVYPQDLQVFRNGVFVTSVPLTSTSFPDTTPSAGTAYTYQLYTVNGGVLTPGPSVVSDATRADAPNPASVTSVIFAPGSNIATVLFTRGAEDADVTYNVIATVPGTGAVVTTKTARYSDATAGSVTMDGFTSYTPYNFSINAVEDAGDPPSDPGQTTPSAIFGPATSQDVSSPSFNSGVLSAARTAVGTITASWPSASDSGTGVDHYTLCLDGGSCQSVPFDPLQSTTTQILQQVPDDGQTHTVSVVAVDGAGNTSSMIATPVFMQPLAAPQITFAGHTDGCGPLIPQVSSPDGSAGTPAGLAFPITVQGGTLAGSGEVIGDPFAPVTISAQATFGNDASAVATSTQVRINDPDGPTDSPSVVSQTDASSGTATLSWAPITAVGAPVVGYQVAVTPGAVQIVGQAPQPQFQLAGLATDQNYLVEVQALDACGRLSPTTDQIQFRLNDSTPPSVPTGLQATLTGIGRSIHLSWAKSSDNVQVNQYIVTRQGLIVARTTSTSFDDPNLADAQTYTYRVVAVDTSGNSSKPSAALNVTTRDLTPPSATGNPHATLNGGTVTLSWSAATDNVGVAGYLVSRDGHQVGAPSGTSYVDKSVPAGTHTWTVVAVDAAGNQSAPRSTDPIATNGAPAATKASVLKVVASKGVKAVRIGGKTGSRLVLSFKLVQRFDPAVLRLQVLSGKAKLRISLPSGTGRTTPGKRLAERAAKKGMLLIPIGNMKPQTLRIIVTASHGGLVTLAGAKGAKPPVIMPKS
jgi:chitodextrinase